MHRVDLVPTAVLLHLDALTIIDLVFLGDVVTTLALLASQRHLNTLFVLCHVFYFLNLYVEEDQIFVSQGGRRRSWLSQ